MRNKLLALKSRNVSHAYKDHGGRNANYFTGMNKSMLQKIGITTAYFLTTPGSVIADLGMGSGYGSYILALMYPHIQVYGVDIDPSAVLTAKETYHLPNLQFIIGDIEQKIDYPEGKIPRGSFNSSSLHHVYSFNGYNKEHVKTAIFNQVEQLGENDTIIIRDFVAPEDKYVLLELPDVHEGETPLDMSDADLLVEFSKTARSLSEKIYQGFNLEELPPKKNGTRLFRLKHRDAVEFVLRKDYRKDWNIELKEAYTYFTQEEFENIFRAAGLRIIVSAPYKNPWIVANRFKNKFTLDWNTGIFLCPRFRKATAICFLHWLTDSLRI